MWAWHASWLKVHHPIDWTLEALNKDNNRAIICFKKKAGYKKKKGEEKKENKKKKRMKRMHLILSI